MVAAAAGLGRVHRQRTRMTNAMRTRAANKLRIQCVCRVLSRARVCVRDRLGDHESGSIALCATNGNRIYLTHTHTHTQSFPLAHTNDFDSLRCVCYASPPAEPTCRDASMRRAPPRRCVALRLHSDHADPDGPLSRLWLDSHQAISPARTAITVGCLHTAHRHRQARQLRHRHRQHSLSHETDRQT